VTAIVNEVEKKDNNILIDKFRSISRNRIIENYTWEKITDQYKNLFIDLTFKKVKKTALVLL
jgi:glycosyltransferase involved in cell wall biosynthesis